MTILIIAVGLSIVVSALCSLLESILYSTGSIALEAQAQKGSRRAGRMKGFKNRVDRPLAAILVLNTVANTAGAAVAGWAAVKVFGVDGLWIFSALFTLAILIFSEIIPKTLGVVHWRSLWRLSVAPLTAMMGLTMPIIWLTQAITRLITGGVDQKTVVSEEEILAAAHLGARGGEISEMERELIQNIIQLEDVRARDIMTPRTVVFSADGEMPLVLARERARDWPHSRVPVIKGGPEDVVGYVSKDQVVGVHQQDPRQLLAELAMPIRFIPSSANALNLLGSFLRQREHLYLVVDEYGGIMGLITLEDVLESLVGSEIVDEHEPVADLQEMARKRGKEILGKNEEG